MSVDAHETGSDVRAAHARKREWVSPRTVSIWIICVASVVRDTTRTARRVFVSGDDRVEVGRRPILRCEGFGCCGGSQGLLFPSLQLLIGVLLLVCELPQTRR